MSQNVIQFRASSAVASKAIEHHNSESTVTRAFPSLPEKKPSWEETWAKRKEGWRRAAIIPEVASVLDPNFKPIQPVSTQPQIAPRDISEELGNLPSIDSVRQALSMLVPAECLALQGFSHFLDACHSLKERCHVTKKMQIEKTAEGTGQHVEDTKTLTRTELRERYPAEYDSWKNRKHKAKKNFNPVFSDFADFITIMGPMPGEGYTLDRIDNNDPEYAPGKVRWANKQEQANNRSNTTTLTVNGVEKPLSDWARETGKDPALLRQRHSRGWPDEEVVYGRGGKGRFVADLAARPWNYHHDADKRAEAENLFQQHMRLGETPMAFCAQMFQAGLGPWENFLIDNDNGGEEDDPFAGIAPHCVAEIQKARQMLFDLAPARRWLDNIQAEIKARKEAAKNKHFPRPIRTRSRYEDRNLHEEAHAELYAERDYDRTYKDDDLDEAY